MISLFQFPFYGITSTIRSILRRCSPPVDMMQIRVVLMLRPLILFSN